MSSNRLVIQNNQNHMATQFSFQLSCLSHDAMRAGALLDELHERIATLENHLTEFREVSSVYQFNHLKKTGTRVSVSPHVIHLLKTSQKLYELTGGAFNVLSKTPDPAYATFEFIHWNEETCEIWKDHPEIWLGFGAIGKGYALDQVRVLVEQAGFENYVLSAGGSSIILSGMEAPGVPWKWGWSWKRDEEGDSVGMSFIHRSGEPIALGISGFHEQGAHIEGASGEHPSSALIAHPSAEMADALSTALFVMDWEQGFLRFQTLLVKPAMALMDAQECPIWNEGFQKRWGRPDEEEGASSLLSSFNSASLAISAFILSCFYHLFSQSAFAEELIDLDSLGVDEFNPYQFERDSIWILAPVLMILFVLWHVKKVKLNLVKPIPKDRRESAFSKVKRDDREAQ